MISRFNIDGIDCTSQYGLRIAESSFAQLIAWPALKPIDVTDWHEEDGVDPDLDAPALDSRTFTLRFVGNTTRAKMESFMSLWRNGVYHLLSTGVGRKYQLRLVGDGKPRWIDGLCFIDLKLADDFPLYLYTHTPPTSSVAYSDDYMLDGVSLTDYGVIILSGTQDQLLQTPPVKDNLATSSATKNGIDYDRGGTVTYGAYNARITCLMRAQTLDELWRNYDALLYDLVRPNKRELKAKSLGKSFPFYYVSERVRRFFPDGKIWLEFEIVINVLSPAYNLADE